MTCPAQEVSTAVAQSIQGEQTLLVTTTEVAIPVEESSVHTELFLSPFRQGEGRDEILSTPELLFNWDDTISLFQKRNNKVRISWGSTSQALVPRTVELDTGAGPILVGKHSIPAAWLKTIPELRRTYD